MVIDILKIFTVASLTFFIGIAITPIFTHYAFKHKLWKKTVKKEGGLDGGATPVYDSLRKGDDPETKTPRMGGIIIWTSVFITIFIAWLMPYIFPGDIVAKLDFLSRNQTWLPILTLLGGAIFGMLDDIIEIKNTEKGKTGGLPRKIRIGLVLLIGLIGGWWFFAKLGVAAIYLPFIGNIGVGWWIVPIFMFFMLGLYSGGVIDGIDGLSGGVFGSMYAAYAIIAFFQGQINIAAFCVAIVGGTLAFLWFNIPPARFYMTETGTMPLTITLTVVAFLTDSVAPLLIIAAPLIGTSATVVLQQLSKKFRGGKKIFLSTPVHHHFEAIGWPGYKVTMRYWIISLILAIVGTVVALA